MDKEPVNRIVKLWHEHQEVSRRLDCLSKGTSFDFTSNSGSTYFAIFSEDEIFNDLKNMIEIHETARLKRIEAELEELVRTPPAPDLLMG